LVRKRDGTYQVVIHASRPGPAYTPPPVHREVLDFDLDDALSDVFRKTGEWVAGELERRALEDGRAA
jgi:hypothetical protein